MMHRALSQNLLQLLLLLLLLFCLLHFFPPKAAFSFFFWLLNVHMWALSPTGGVLYKTRICSACKRRRHLFYSLYILTASDEQLIRTSDILSSRGGTCCLFKNIFFFIYTEQEP
jgi:hypothetical protein